MEVCGGSWVGWVNWSHWGDRSSWDDSWNDSCWTEDRADGGGGTCLIGPRVVGKSLGGDQVLTRGVQANYFKQFFTS